MTTSRMALLVAGLVLVRSGSGLGQPPQASSSKPLVGPAQQQAEDNQAAKKPPGNVDLYGDPLPPGAVARLGTVRFRALDEAQALAFAPDGKTVAVSASGGVFLFDAASGKRIKRLGDNAHARYMKDPLAFAPEGKRLLAWGHWSVMDAKGVGKVTSGVRVWRLAGDRGPQEYDAEHVMWAGWSPTGEPMTASLEKDGVLLRELAAGRSRRFACADLRRPESADSVACACAPGGQTLVVGDEKNILHVWDTDTGAERRTIPIGPDHYLRSLAVSPDGRRLALLKEQRQPPQGSAVHIWDTVSGKSLLTLAADHKNMTTLAFSPDNKTLATVGWNGIRFWDVATGRERSRAEGQGANTVKLAFSGDGSTLATLQRHSSAFHLWDVVTGQRKEAPVGHASRPYGTSFSPDGRKFASSGGHDGTIHVWDLDKSKSLFSIHRGGWARRVHFSPDGRRLYSSWTDDQVWISDAANAEKQHVLKLEDPERPDWNQSALSTHLSTDGKTLVVFSSYHGKTGQGTNHDERLLTGWDPTTQKLLFRRRLPATDWPAVSVDTRLLASAHVDETTAYEMKAPGQGPMRLEKLATGERLLTFPNLEGQTHPLAFSPDGRLLASSNFNYKRYKEGDPNSTRSRVQLWELATAAEVFSGPLGGQSRVAFSPDGRLLATTGTMRDIIVWDLAHDRELRRFKGFEAVVSWLVFTPDGRQLISGLADSTLLVWDVKAPAEAAAIKHDAAALRQAWERLAGSDAAKAFRARWTLANAPDAALSLCKKHLKPVTPADAKRLRGLIADLDSGEFPVRAAATKELEELGDLAAGALRQTTKTQSLELSRRAQALLDKLRGPITRPEVLQAVRAVAVLEDVAGQEACTLLNTLAQGAPDAHLTQEARAALERLARVKGARPNPAFNE